MKKYIHIIICIIVAVAFAGCNDWLDVEPRSESREDDLYSSENGFKSALTGVYIKMGTEELYGRNTSYFFTDILTQNWAWPSDKASLRYLLANWDFDNSTVQGRVATIWKNHYNNIAQLNNLLDNLETANVRFNYGNDLLIEGEAKGLRAFLHFEVLRLFGPVPSLASSGETTIPYLTTFTSDISQLVSTSYGEILKHIEADLNAAEELLKDDPIVKIPNDSLNSTSSKTSLPEDLWQRYRQNRFNYYAVLGTKARFYSYTGNSEKAVEYAKKVIDAIDRSGNSNFTLTTGATIRNKWDYVMHCEALFSLHSYKLQTIILDMFVQEKCQLTQGQEYITEMFEGQVDDIRFFESPYWTLKAYSNDTRVYHFIKYADRTGVTSPNYVPLLRLVEMYFIIIENAGIAEAQQYFDTYCAMRNLDANVMDDLSDTPSVRDRLIKEYRKEFFGEGQLFYFMKKHQYLTYTWPVTFNVPSVESYVIPKPDAQIIHEDEGWIRE